MIDLDTAIDQFAQAHENFRAWKKQRDSALAALLPHLFSLDWSKRKSQRLTSALSGVEIEVEMKDGYRDDSVNITVKVTGKGDKE